MSLQNSRPSPSPAPSPDDPVILVRDRRKRSWYWANNYLYESVWLNSKETTFAAELGPSGVSVYHYLCRCADNDSQSCDPGTRAIMRATGLSKPVVVNAKAKMRDLGMVKINPRKLRSGGDDTDEFILMDAEEWDLQGGKDSLPGGNNSQNHATEVNFLNEGGQDSLRGGVKELDPRGKDSLPAYKDEQDLVQQDLKQQHSTQQAKREIPSSAKPAVTSAVDVVDVVILNSSHNQPEATPPGGHVLGEINTADSRLAKRNEKATKHDASQQAAQAGQPLLAGAALSPAPSPKPPAEAELLRRVQQIGVSGNVAKQLVAEHREETERQLAYWPFQKGVGKPGAWFPSAVRGAYEPPPAYMAAQEARQREEALAEERRQEQERQQQQRAVMQAEDARKAALDAEFAALLDSEKGAFDEEILRRNPGLTVLFQHQDAEGRERTLASHRRQLLREGWQPKETAPRRLDREAPSSALDAAFSNLPATEVAEIENRILAYLKKAGAEVARESAAWLTLRHKVMREMIEQGVLKLQAQAA